ncbi:hypothetical protein FKM82_016264 [Ascaphus truei]
MNRSIIKSAPKYQDSHFHYPEHVSPSVHQSPSYSSCLHMFSFINVKALNTELHAPASVLPLIPPLSNGQHCEYFLLYVHRVTQSY